MNEHIEFTDELFSANSQIFWFGDLNYRINMSDEEVRKLVAQKKWDELINYDQVRRHSNSCYRNSYFVLFIRKKM